MKKTHKIIIISGLLLFSTLSAESIHKVTIDNKHIQTYQSVTGKWIFLKDYKENIKQLISEFGTDMSEFKKLNQLKNLRISQTEVIFIPYGEKYLKSLFAQGKGRKIIQKHVNDIILPVSSNDYNITSKMGRRNGLMHTGLDMACPVGTPIVAAADGVVETAGVLGNYGFAVVIDHPGLNKIPKAHLPVY